MKAQEDIAQHENKGYSSHSSSSHKKDRYTLIKGLKSPGNRSPASQHGRLLVLTARKGRAGLPSSYHVWPRASLLINDNYCVSRRLAGSKQTLYVNQCH